jgi:hypothetical protein
VNKLAGTLVLTTTQSVKVNTESPTFMASKSCVPEGHSTSPKTACPPRNMQTTTHKRTKVNAGFRFIKFLLSNRPNFNYGRNPHSVRTLFIA